MMLLRSNGALCNVHGLTQGSKALVFNANSKSFDEGRVHPLACKVEASARFHTVAHRKQPHDNSSCKLRGFARAMSSGWSVET